MFALSVYNQNARKRSTFLNVEPGTETCGILGPGNEVYGVTGSVGDACPLARLRRILSKKKRNMKLSLYGPGSCVFCYPTAIPLRREERKIKKETERNRETETETEKKREKERER